MGSYSEALQLGGGAAECGAPLGDLPTDCPGPALDSAHRGRRRLRIAAYASLASGVLAAAVFLVMQGGSQLTLAPEGPLVAPSVDEVLEQIEVFERMRQVQERRRNATEAWRQFYDQVTPKKTRPLTGAQKAQCGVSATIDSFWFTRAIAFANGAAIDCASGPVYQARCAADILGVIHCFAHMAAMLAGIIGGCDEYISSVDRRQAACANAVIFAVDHFLAISKLSIIAHKSCVAAERQRKGLPPSVERIDAPGVGAWKRSPVVHEQMRKTFCVVDSIQPALMLTNAGLAINNINPVCKSIDDQPTQELRNEKLALCTGVMLSATSLFMRAAGMFGLAASHCHWTANKDAICTASSLLIAGRSQAIGGAISRATVFCPKLPAAKPEVAEAMLNISDQDPVAGVDSA